MQFQETRPTSLMRAIAGREGKSIEAAITEAIDETGTLTGAAALLGIDKLTLSRWMTRLGLGVRTIVEPIEPRGPASGSR